MRVEHYLTGMWVVLVGTLFWVIGFVLSVSYFWLNISLGGDWMNYIGMILSIAGIFLIVVGGQVIRMAMAGETIQPTEESRKIRLLVCPNCSMENPEDATYCLGCGKKFKKLVVPGDFGTKP